MGGSKIDLREAFVERIRAEARAGAEYINACPLHAGSTKTALALTRLAYECGERDAGKTHGKEMNTVKTDLSWAKLELARKIEEDEEIKKLRVDLRWAKFQVAKKEESMDKELEKLRTELDVALQELGQKKGCELDESNITAAHNYDVRRLSKELEDTRNEKDKYQKLFEEASHRNMSNVQFSSDEFRSKVEALEKIIDAVEVQFLEHYSQMQSQIAQAQTTAEEMAQKNEALHAQLAIEKAKSEEQAKKIDLDEDRTEKLKKEHGRALAGYRTALVNLNNSSKGVWKEKNEHQKHANDLQRQLNNKTADCEVAKQKAAEADHEVGKLKALDRVSNQVIKGLVKQNKDLKEKYKTQDLEEKDVKFAEVQQALLEQQVEVLGLQDRIKFLIDEKELQRQEYQEKLSFLSSGKGPGNMRGRTKTSTP